MTSYRKQLQDALRKWLPNSFFSQWPVRAGVFWIPQRLIWTALLMARDEGQTMRAR